MTNILKCRHIWAHEHWFFLSRFPEDHVTRYPKSLYQGDKDKLSCCNEHMTVQEWERLKEKIAEENTLASWERRHAINN